MKAILNKKTIKVIYQLNKKWVRKTINKFYHKRLDLHENKMVESDSYLNLYENIKNEIKM